MNGFFFMGSTQVVENVCDTLFDNLFIAVHTSMNGCLSTGHIGLDINTMVYTTKIHTHTSNFSFLFISKDFFLLLLIFSSFYTIVSFLYISIYVHTYINKYSTLLNNVLLPSNNKNEMRK